MIDHAAAGATMYAVFFAGLLEFIAGMWLIAKGESYIRKGMKNRRSGIPLLE